MSDNDIEQEIQDKGLTSPRVTLAHVESCIAYEWYLTGDAIPKVATPVLGPAYLAPLGGEALKCLTLCVLVLKNGFTVTGESSCASPENFDAEVGRKLARENAVRKIWSLEGYLLKERLYNDAQVKASA